MKTITLTDEQFDFLMEKLWDVQDEGPCCGGGWKSDELTAFIKEIERQGKQNTPVRTCGICGAEIDKYSCCNTE